MDGRQYIECFEAPNYEKLHETYADLGATYSVDLTQKISLLHTGEVRFLGDEPEPVVVSLARETMQEMEATRQIYETYPRFRHERLLELGYTYIPDKVDRSRIFDALEEEDPSAVSVVNHEARFLQDMLTQYSDVTLSLAILGIHRVHNKNAKKPSASSEIAAVKNAIAEQRSRLAEITQQYPTITIIRDTYDRKQVGFSVEANGERKSVPNWLVDTEDWDTPLHRYMASVIELEALIVANEWSIDRGHTFMPLLAPRHIEQGSYVSDKNPHADILLCNVSASTNEIAPLQVKNHIRQRYIDRYIDEMEYITPEDLGIRRTGTATVKNFRGRAATGTRSITHVGYIAAAYTARYNKSRKPSKPQIMAYRKLLQPGFVMLDAIIARQRQKTIATTVAD